MPQFPHMAHWNSSLYFIKLKSVLLITTSTVIMKLEFLEESNDQNVMQILATLELFSLAFPPASTRRKPNVVEFK